MKKYCFLLIMLLWGQMLNAQKTKGNVDRPKLVVGIVVDQMRWDYLYRYYERYGNQGFRRLMDKGFNCQQAFVNYLPSFTAPGHSCIYTGSVPAIHGIAANDWIDIATGRSWYCTEDTTVLPVGGSYKAGRMSPNNLLTTTVTDELRFGTNFKAKTIGISLKDRGSILPAGHLATGAYWYDDSTGNFITSTYYTKALPKWVNDFNYQHLPEAYLQKGWETLYPIETYKQSIADDNAYEGVNKGEKKPVFPHKTARTEYQLLRKIPAGNTFTFDMAKASITNEQLGKRDVTDFLAVSLSTPDYIGHQYAPNSIEVEDTYLRLDADLATFLNFLDKTIGKGEYTVFLTADHGAAHNAQFLVDSGIHAGNATPALANKNLKSFIKNLLGSDSAIITVSNYQVSFNEAFIERAKIDRQLLRNVTRKWLEQQEGIANVIDMENVMAVPEPIATMAINGYNRKRSGSLLIITEPGWYSGYGKTGTTHGTWNPYDSHIPLLFYGWGIKKGSTNNVVNMTDIAPTIAALLHVQMPNGCIGKPIAKVLE